MDLRDVLTLLAAFGTGGVFGGWAREWLNRRHEDRFRWHNERRAAYERFLTAIDKARATELVVAEYLGGLRGATGWGDDPLFDEETLLREAEKLDDAWAKYAVSKTRAGRLVANSAHLEVNSSLAAMDMLSAEPVVAAGQAVRLQLRALIRKADEFPPRECGGWSEPLVEVDADLARARERFVSAIRKELGVRARNSESAV